MFKYAVMMVLALATLTGCVSVNYMGDNYTATADVKIFEDRTLIPEDFVEIGKCVAYGRYDSYSKEKICEKVREKAEDVGADVVYIYAYQVVPESVITGRVENVWNDYTADTIWQRMDNDFTSYGQIGKDTTSKRSTSSYMRVVRAEFLKDPATKGEPIKSADKTASVKKVGPDPSSSDGSRQLPDDPKALAKFTPTNADELEKRNKDAIKAESQKDLIPSPIINPKLKED